MRSTPHPSPPRASKLVFVSSTVRDLVEERALVKRELEAIPWIDVRCRLSEAPDFPVTGRQVRSSAYQVSLEAVRQSDFVIQILKSRYGMPDIEDEGQLISITHQERREAWRARLPIFTIVHSDLWDEASRSDPRPLPPGGTGSLRALLDEIRLDDRKNWISRYESLADLRQILEHGLLATDDSEFVADLTCPDGTIMDGREEFEKRWAIQNVGWVPWRGRRLREVNPGNGLIPESREVAVPETLPGQVAELAVRFTAPKYPGSYESRWKMFDENGRECFTWRTGVWCRITVIRY
jgi:hypothetical protein